MIAVTMIDSYFEESFFKELKNAQVISTIVSNFTLSKIFLQWFHFRIVFDSKFCIVMKKLETSRFKLKRRLVPPSTEPAMEISFNPPY